jgi:hypothetical protein
MDHEQMIKSIIGTDDDYEETSEKILKRHQQAHKKYIDRIYQKEIDND